MKKLHFILPVFTLLLLSGCSVIGGIFKAGFAVGIIAVVVIIFVLIWVISLFRK